MALFGTVDTVRAQLASQRGFEIAFAYLQRLFAAPAAERGPLRVPIGETLRVELGEGVFALEQAYRSKPRTEGFFESHRRLIDVQVVFEGEEWFEVGDVGRFTVRTAYQETRDLIVYEDAQPLSQLHLRAAEAAVFFPADVHMPGLCGTMGPAVVRKTVIKVPVA